MKQHLTLSQQWRYNMLINTEKIDVRRSNTGLYEQDKTLQLEYILKLPAEYISCYDGFRKILVAINTNFQMLF